MSTLSYVLIRATTDYFMDWNRIYCLFLKQLEQVSQYIIHPTFKSIALESLFIAQVHQ